MTTEPANTEDLIETMARGMAADVAPPVPRWEFLSEELQTAYLRAARAALSAMRERGWEPVKQGASADADRALALRAEPPAASPSLRDCDPSRGSPA